MHLYTLIAFALIFVNADHTLRWPLFGRHEWGWTLSLLVLQLVILTVASLWSRWRTLRLLNELSQGSATAQVRHHRYLTILKVFVLLSFVFLLYFTRWLDICYAPGFSPPLRFLEDLLALLPFLGGVTLLWWLSYPADRALRARFSVQLPSDHTTEQPGWTRWGYVVFNLRHHVLVIALPLLVILYSANITNGYYRTLQRWFFGWPFAADTALGVVAVIVFGLSPLALRYIWPTHPLPAGPLRTKLETLCSRIGLGCREILVWNSDAMIVNAAVMGLIKPLRFVILSDGLLESMTERQIEAVFGHEAGHVKHHHIEYFLLFALGAMLVVWDSMEIMLQIDPRLSPATVEGTGAVLTLLIWGGVFGFISRRFERQADTFGAWCVVPGEQACHLPCSYHCGSQTVGCKPVPQETDTIVSPVGNRCHICTTAAEIFVSALDRVAVLNGIGHEDRSWRHSSIGSRMRFLTALSGDPKRAERFQRSIRRIKAGLVTGVIVTGGMALYYALFVHIHTG